MSIILVVAAHPDDEILGVGGTIARRVAEGDKAYALILGEGQTSRWNTRRAADTGIVEELHKNTLEAAEIVGYSRVFFENLPDNRFDSVDLLDIVKKIEHHIQEIQPDVIYTHHNGDLNIDHRITCKAVLTATRPIGTYSVKEIYKFETVSSTEWNFGNRETNFYPNVFVDIEKYFGLKCRAMEQYESELCSFPHPRSLEMLRSLARKWGGVVGNQYVEAFELVRMVVQRDKTPFFFEGNQQKRIYLREADEKDVDVLFHWVNDPVARKNQFSTKPIPYEEHRKWYEKILNSQDCKQYIYMYDESPIGEARITIHGNEAEISYSICRERRGMGHGKNLLRLLGRQVKDDFPEIQKMTAKVKPDNIASQQAFLETGYVEKYSAFELDLHHLDIGEECSEEVRGGVIFLTNNENALELYFWLRSRCQVHLYSEKVEIEQIQALSPDIIISYNYNYVIDSEVINYMKGNIINLHISLLPWNRGCSPNIWSFIEDTPKGVTIHQMDAGLDTGKIIFQKECYFEPEKETFISTYNKLNGEIVALFQRNWEALRDGKYVLQEQTGEGSYHTKQDLKKLQSEIEFEWSDHIAEFIEKYKARGKE